MEDSSSDGKSLREVLSFLGWRKGLILVTAVAVAAIAAAAAVGLPATYRSSATILVQEQEIPPELVKSTITSYADERIQVISQQIMTRAVLLKMADKYALYPKLRKRVTDEEILDRMQKDIKITTIDANVSDRRSGQRVNATIAFRISYDSKSPEQAQQVVEELTNLYLSENAKVREQSINQTAAFLAQEADRVGKQIQEIEANLAVFKRRYADRLPESSATNLQLADRLQSDLLRVEREISTAQDRKVFLEAELQSVKPYLPAASDLAAPPGERVLSPEERLRALEAQLATAIAQYQDDHPDVKRLKRQIEAVKGDIVAAEKEASRSNGKPTERLRKPDNPAYITLAAQLENTKRELVQLAGMRDDLREKQRAYDARLRQIPEIEREYRDLTRDYDNAQARYREVKAKQMQAEVAQELERDRKAERFTLGEPANLPRKPVSPNRPAILMLGLLASLGSGVGLAWLRDLFDQSVKGPAELARLVNLPILTAIPYIHTQRERLLAQKHGLIVTALSVALALVFVTLIHFFAKPLPDILSAVLRLLGI